MFSARINTLKGLGQVYSKRLPWIGGKIYTVILIYIIIILKVQPSQTFVFGALENDPMCLIHDQNIKNLVPQIIGLKNELIDEIDGWPLVLDAA